MSEVQVFTQKGEGKASNEDRAVYGENWMAVFDGATQAEPPADGKDGGWYAEHLSQNVKRILDDQPDLELAQVVHDAIKQLATDHPLDPDTAPSSTVAIARWREDSVDMYVLGDSFIVWEDEESTLTFLCDERLRERVALKERKEFHDSRILNGAQLETLKNLQRAERAMRNKPGGYWIASNTPTAAFQGLSKRPSSKLVTVACCSDGIPMNAVCDTTVKLRTHDDVTVSLRKRTANGLRSSNLDRNISRQITSNWPTKSLT